MLHEFARSPDQRWSLTRPEVPDVEGCQKVGLIGNRRGENRHVFGVRWSSRLWTRAEVGGGAMVTAAFRINSKGASAAGSFAARFRSASFTAYWRSDPSQESILLVGAECGLRQSWKPRPQ